MEQSYLHYFVYNLRNLISGIYGKRTEKLYTYCTIP